MSRKKRSGAVITGATTTPQSDATAAAERSASLDAPFSNPATDVPGTDRDEPAMRWGDPYKAFFSSTAKGFEMGENRRFKQRVFRFHERPDPSVTDALKEHGFTYRAAEKCWTIPANPATRRLSEELAHQFAGGSQDRSR